MCLGRPRVDVRSRWRVSREYEREAVRLVMTGEGSYTPQFYCGTATPEEGLEPPTR